MIKELFECGCFDYKEFIHQKQKALSLTNDEAMVLIQILNIYKIHKNISNNDLYNVINMSQNDIDNVLAKLLERDIYSIFVSFDDGLGEESISLDGFFNLVEKILLNQIPDKQNELFIVNNWLSQKFNRILSSNEIDIISSLVGNDGYTLLDFKNAYKSLEGKYKLITIKNLTAALAKDLNVKEKPQNVMIKSFMDSIK